MKNNVYSLPHHQSNFLKERALAIVTTCKQGMALHAKIGNGSINIDRQAEHIRTLHPGDEVVVEQIAGMNVITTILLAANKKPPPTFVEQPAGVWSLQIGNAKISIAEIGSIHIMTPKACIELNKEGLCLLDADIQEIKGRIIKLN